ncbi:MAG: hypothetical protein ACE5IB_07715, partial [Candidatus Geothermarchaeales archaeon]
MSLIQLTWSEFLRMLRAPASLYFFLGAIGFLGFIFFLMSTFRVAIFLDLAYLLPPVVLPAPRGDTDHEREGVGVRQRPVHPSDLDG